tara:strand:+ start:98 stop:319 length:222 start_codon:yes stop_codon:yes gene_type:complete
LKDEMKGKPEFSRAEADQIQELIKTKLKAGRPEQKKIRNQIRSLGFYYSNFYTSNREGGYNQEDFLNAVKIRS